MTLFALLFLICLLTTIYCLQFKNLCYGIVIDICHLRSNRFSFFISASSALISAFFCEHKISLDKLVNVHILCAREGIKVLIVLIFFSRREFFMPFLVRNQRNQMGGDEIWEERKNLN